MASEMMILPEVAELLEADSRVFVGNHSMGQPQDDLQQLQQNAAADGLSAISLCDGLRL